MTKISGFENFEIVKMGQKGPFSRKPVWGQKRLQILLWFEFLFSFIFVLIDFLHRQRLKEVATIRLNIVNASFMDLDNFSRQNDFIEVRLIGGFRQDCRKT